MPSTAEGWGETRISRVATTGFDRASKQPLAIAAINYNNAAGIRAMAGALEWRRLGISEKTVKFHRGRVMEKLRARNLVDLIRAVEGAQAGGEAHNFQIEWMPIPQIG